MEEAMTETYEKDKNGIISKIQTVQEVDLKDATVPIKRIRVSDDVNDIFALNGDSGWEIDKVFTDYTTYAPRHNTVIVIFKRKDASR